MAKTIYTLLLTLCVLLSLVGCGKKAEQQTDTTEVSETVESLQPGAEPELPLDAVDELELDSPDSDSRPQQTSAPDPTPAAAEASEPVQVPEENAPAKTEPAETVPAETEPLNGLGTDNNKAVELPEIPVG